MSRYIRSQQINNRNRVPSDSSGSDRRKSAKKVTHTLRVPTAFPLSREASLSAPTYTGSLSAFSSQTERRQLASTSIPRLLECSSSAFPCSAGAPTSDNSPVRWHILFGDILFPLTNAQIFAILFFAH